MIESAQRHIEEIKKAIEVAKAHRHRAKNNIKRTKYLKLFASLPLSLCTLILILLIFSFAFLKGEELSKEYTSKYLSAYKAKILQYNPNLSSKEADYIVHCIIFYCKEYKLYPPFAVAVIACESLFNPKATSSAGACGLGQLMPETAKSWGVHNCYDIRENIRATVSILRHYCDIFSGYSVETQIRLTLASYNAGFGAVQKYGGVPPYPETQYYVEKVLLEYKELCGVK